MLTGGINDSEDLVRRIEENIAGRIRCVAFPNHHQESLAAGLIRGF